MKCPVCGVWTQVKETRRKDDQTKIRRYECGNQHTFRTAETVVKIIKAHAKQNNPGRATIHSVD